MLSNEKLLAVLALFSKRYVELRDAVAHLSRQPGPAGKDGADGARGSDGRDGVDGHAGPAGADGQRGERGPPGKQGPTGPRGEKGERGEKGDRGPTGPAPAHRWKGTRLSFKKPDGEWGKEVDLRGPGGGSGTILLGGGSGGGPAPERIQRTDYNDSRYAYVGFASRIARIDYAVSPPLEQTAASGDWDNRLTLDYL